MKIKKKITCKDDVVKERGKGEKILFSRSLEGITRNDLEKMKKSYQGERSKNDLDKSSVGSSYC